MKGIKANLIIISQLTNQITLFICFLNNFTLETRVSTNIYYVVIATLYPSY